MFADALINLYTNDIEAGIRFYRDLLGLEETFRTPREGSPAHIEFRVGGFTLALSTVEAAKSEHRVDAAPGALEPEVDDLLIDLVDPFADPTDLVGGGCLARAGGLVHHVGVHLLLLGCGLGRAGPGSIKPRAVEPGAWCRSVVQTRPTVAGLPVP